MRLSIIIPAYQAETTLRRCLDSVLSQSFRDVQVILVDDASTDGTHALMEEYCQRDHRVQMLTLQKMKDSVRHVITDCIKRMASMSPLSTAMMPWARTRFKLSWRSSTYILTTTS